MFLLLYSPNNLMPNKIYIYYIFDGFPHLPKCPITISLFYERCKFEFLFTQQRFESWSKNENFNQGFEADFEIIAISIMHNTYPSYIISLRRPWTCRRFRKSYISTRKWFIYERYEQTYDSVAAEEKYIDDVSLVRSWQFNVQGTSIMTNRFGLSRTDGHLGGSGPWPML